MAPLVVKIGTTPGPRDIVSKFHWNWTQQLWHHTTLQFLWGIVSFSGLKKLFFDCIQPWQHLTLLTQQIQLLLWQWHSQNSFQTSHQSHLWPHPLTGMPQSNMMISSCFVNQWKVGSPFKIFQRKQPQELDPMQNPTWLSWNMCSISWATLAHRKFDHWKPTGTADEISKKKKQASAFMDYLSSMMDHAVSQRCRIYQLEDVHIQPRESPDELVDHLHALADWCNFPSDEEKEWNIQYRLVRALNDKELIKKLLTLDLKATTPKMLEVCQTHIAISDNLEAMGLKEQKTVNAIRKQNKPHQGKKPPAGQCALMWTLHKVPPTWPIFMPSMGWHMPWMWKERTLEAQMPKWT